MMFVSSILALVAVAKSSPATIPAPAAQPPAAPVVKEKKICMPDDSTGSIVPKRVCRTRSEWDAYTKEINARTIERPMQNGPKPPQG